jgi:hypothetical protein
MRAALAGEIRRPSRYTHIKLPIARGNSYKKTVKFNKDGIANLPENKPVLYQIETSGGKDNYIGVAKRGRVRERIGGHLAGAKDAIPGSRSKLNSCRPFRGQNKKKK